MKYYISVLKNYAVFTGRSSRSEFWYFALFNFIFSLITSKLDNILGTRVDYDSSYNSLLTHSYTSLHYGYINLIYGLAVFVPGLAVSVRRLHDVGKSGWYILLLFIPFIGWIWILVLFCTDSQYGENQYGPHPYGQGNHNVDDIGSYLTK